MITEDYVSFETAKLLKEKGFEGKCVVWYFNETLVDYTMLGFCVGGEIIPAPTLQMAMKWLREEHNLVISPMRVTDEDGRFEADICFLDDGIDATIDACGHIFADTYEEACEAGIVYCLVHLITKED